LYTRICVFHPHVSLARLLSGLSLVLSACTGQLLSVPATDGGSGPPDDVAPPPHHDGAVPPRDGGGTPPRDGGTSLPPADARAVVELPIEVMGRDGYTESATVHASDVSGVERLWLLAHSIGYPQHFIDERGYDVAKASIRLNGGEWVDVTNEVARCQFPESELLCVTGPYHTIRFTIPIETLGTLVDGENTLEFRFNYASPDTSIGYRILGIELRDAEGADVIDDTAFVWDDPAAWRAPEGYDDADSVARGAELWHARDTLVEGWEGGYSIRAACADCHAEDGRDLQYFGYSNWSIIARSEFHGLSPEQGRQIAAYVRSLELRDSDTGERYDPPGRPWHPPYQPGPTATASRAEDAPRTDGRPFSELSSQMWAAGAGVQWALDEDREMLPYLFPGGPSLDDVHPDESRLNIRELPVAIQMPDWNEWLPVHHPLDAFGETFTDSSIDRADPWEVYTGPDGRVQRFLDCWGGSFDTSCDTIGQRMWMAATDLHVDTDEFRRRLAHGVRPGFQGELIQAIYSLMQWQLVKSWELVHTYDLEDEVQHQRPDADPLQWPGQARAAFNLANHIIGLAKGEYNAVQDGYFDTAWYQHQLTVNSGRGYSTGQSPVDWKYHLPHIGGFPVAQPLRYVASYVVLMQNANDELPDQFRGENWPEGWYFRHVHPRWLVRFGFQIDELASYEPGLESRVLSTVLEAALIGFDHHSPEAWARGTGEAYVEPWDYDPELTYHWGRNELDYATQTMSAVRDFQNRGVDRRVLERLRDWGKRMWPNARGPSWDELL
jgi:hypothetical protein